VLYNFVLRLVVSREVARFTIVIIVIILLFIAVAIFIAKLFL
jgi:hypothetical protein